MFVTTSIKFTPELISEAKHLAKKLHVPYVKRNRAGMQELYQQYDPEAVIVARNGWRYEHQNGHEFFFHPNMSALRIKHLGQGQADAMVEAAGLRVGDTVLDCTLGMGADAIVASYAVGESGKVIALESQTLIATLVEQGFQTYESDRTRLVQAMRRIEVRHGSYQEQLPTFPDQSVDIVLFDPMFRDTVRESAAMQALKPLANPTAIDEQSFSEAKRVARRAVLVKERPRSGEFARLGLEVIKESSHFSWGIWRREG